MAQAGKDASPAGGAIRYERYRSETTLLYQLVDAHYPAFAERMAAHGTPLPAYVQREFQDYLKCGRLEHGFLRVRCEACHAERLVAFSCKRRGFCPSCWARRMDDAQERPTCSASTASMWMTRVRARAFDGWPHPPAPNSPG